MPSWCAPCRQPVDSIRGLVPGLRRHATGWPSRLPAEVGTARSTGPDYRQGNDQGFAGREAACCGLAKGTKLAVPGYSLLASVYKGDRSIAEGSGLYALPSSSLCNSEWTVASPLSTRCRRIVQGSWWFISKRSHCQILYRTLPPWAKLTRPVHGMQGWTDLA